MNREVIWSDRKRPFFGLPWSFTRYEINDKKVLINTGFFTHREEDILLYRIMDITYKASFWQRIFKVGTVHCCSGDKTSPEFDLESIKNPREVKELLSDMVEEQRLSRRVGIREHMMDNDLDDGLDDDFDLDSH